MAPYARRRLGLAKWSAMRQELVVVLTVAMVSHGGLHDRTISANGTCHSIYYSKFARDQYLGRYYIFRHGHHTKTKMACIRGHVYFLNFIVLYQM